MNWQDRVQFSIKDVIHYTVIVASAVLIYTSLKNGQERNMDAVNQLSTIVQEMQKDNKENKKDSYLINQNLQNQVNTNTQQILLIKQEVELSRRLSGN